MIRYIWEKSWIGFLARLFHSFKKTKITHIPDDQLLWRAVHVQSYINKSTKKIKPGFFRNSKGGLSCDLKALTTQKRCLYPWPVAAGIVEFSVKTVRALGANTDVDHIPLTKKENPNRIRNYAHSELVNVTEPDHFNTLAEDESHEIIIQPDYEKLPKDIRDFITMKSR